MDKQSTSGEKDKIEKCPFCRPDPRRVHYTDDIGMIMDDGFPVSQGHALVVPREHYSTVFEMPAPQYQHLFDLVKKAQEIICQRYAPDGFNIGLNSGKAAGQTVPHAHIHVIPRYNGDVEDPRGGVRWIIPEKAEYWR